MTEQHHAERTRVSWILEQYRRTGVVDHVQRAAPRYVDLSEVPSFEEAFNLVERAEEAFARLPAEVRAEVGNNPIGLVEWVQDPENLERGLELGIFETAPGDRESSSGGSGQHELDGQDRPKGADGGRAAEAERSEVAPPGEKRGEQSAAREQGSS